ncbi:DNA-processing protein DprA [Pseudodesulfovibrio tunisiensis]|uniref:DNA-processing protein DprA n=1 Tax=Pseudodesulfovibrio tunisiensis TaxID=463192 RepID=UPI001FB30566|nr:DNA-processing protein DprA [Pseudodesulfovibrio tunisiensis]
MLDQKTEFFACLALKHTPYLGPKTWKQILEQYASAYEAVRDARNWPGCRLANARQAENCAREKWRQAAEDEFFLAKRRNFNVLTWFDPAYPEPLKQISDPPVCLYYDGDLSLLRNPGVAVVGARACTEAGLSVTLHICSELAAAGITVVSGMALGIDRQAHVGGLSGVGSSIAVMGTGLDVLYPMKNKDLRERLGRKGLVVTEFGPGVKAESSHFPLRNRIISGLSLGVLVAEAGERSGSLITARLAADQGREVFALPGPIGQSTFAGCHKLIKQGATLVESADDILCSLSYACPHALQPLSKPGSERPSPERFAASESCVRQEPGGSATVSEEAASDSSWAIGMRQRTLFGVTDEEKELLGLLDETGRMHIDTLGRTLGWTSSRVSRVLLVLEMRGIVQQLPGMWYIAKEN